MRDGLWDEYNYFAVGKEGTEVHNKVHSQLSAEKSRTGISKSNRDFFMLKDFR